MPTTEHPPTPPPVPYGTMARRAPDGAFTFSALLPGSGDCELEVGFGRGRFLLERARAAPGSRILGIEIKAKWAHLVEQRRLREGLENVVALAGDAREVLPRMEGSLQRAFLHFPDPWWKKRHAKRRVLADDFLTQIARLLAPGAELFIQTDVEDRAESMREQIQQFGDARVFSVEFGELVNPYGARSNREVRAEEDGLPIHRIVARRC